MSDSKVYMFPENNSGNMLSLLAPLLQQRGIDPSVLLAMNNGGFGGCGFIWILFLMFFWGQNGFGFGNGRNGQMAADLGNLINNDAGRDLLMQAINRNGDAVNQLASTLNCDINSVQTAINAVMSQIQNVGGQLNMSAQQIINATQNGDFAIQSKLAECCCENRLAIANQTNTLQNSINTVATGQERGFSSVAYETQRQTCSINDSIKDATDKILAGQKEAELREMQNKIDSLREANSQKDVIINNGQQTAIFSQMISNATTPIVQALNGLQSDVNGVKCRLPETVTLPYSCATAVPTQSLYGYNIATLGFNNGCACGTNSLWG